MNTTTLNMTTLDGGVIIKKGGGGGSVASLMTEVTWQELKDLRDSGKLIAGMKYRMIDYDTYTSQPDTESAMHPFDLILTALDNKTLSEECGAMHSARDVDGYYYGINLESWDVRYCLDNDTKRFVWALDPHLEVEVDGQKVNLSQVSFLEQLFNEQYQAIDIPRDTFGMYMDGTGVEQWMIFRSPVIDNCIADVILYNATLEDVQVAEDFYLPPKSGVVLVTQTMPVTQLNKFDNTGKGVIYRIIDEFSNDVSYDWTNIVVKIKTNNYYGLGNLQARRYQKGIVANNLITSLNQDGRNLIPAVNLESYSDGYEHYLIGNRVINSNAITISGQKIIGNIIEGCKNIYITNGYFVNFMFNTLRGVPNLNLNVPQGGTPFNYTTFLSQGKYFTTEELYNAITATKTE